MKQKIVIASFALLFISGLVARAATDEPDAFHEISEHYEAIRLSLVEDTMTDVAERAAAIEHRIHQLERQFEAGAAGVTAEKSAECEALLPEVSSAAARLAEGKGLEEAREAMFELSKPMGRYRKLAGVEGSMVVFCPMAKKAWIQPHGDIGNPYMGQDMPRCGKRIAD